MAQPPPEARLLPSPPTDGITSLSYHGSSSYLVSTSWDGSLRIHDTQDMTHVLTASMECGPLLSLAAAPASHSIDKSAPGFVFTGGIDGSIRKFDIATSSVSLVGMHSRDAPRTGEKQVACSCLSWIGGGDADSSRTVVASAGWDGFFHLWDTRQSSRKPVATLELPGKAFSMDATTDGSKVVVSTSRRRNCFIDVRSMKELVEENASEDAAKLVLDRESSLKFQTRVVRFFPDGTGLALGSIEGRVAIEYMDEIGIKSGKKKYAFKCHRVGETVYPVNSIAFNRKYGTFATGGCDGTVVTWDGANKKKISSVTKFPTSVACMAFNHDGTQLAAASSYTFEEGERDHPRDEIYVREMLDSEVKPKATK